MNQSRSTRGATQFRHTEKQALSRREAAGLLGISEGMMIKLVRLGRVKAIHIGKCVRVSRDEIQRILKQGIRL
jgi:excisionase family DNA binding protein